MPRDRAFRRRRTISRDKYTAENAAKELDSNNGNYRNHAAEAEHTVAVRHGTQNGLRRD